MTTFVSKITSTINVSRIIPDNCNQRASPQTKLSIEQTETSHQPDLLPLLIKLCYSIIHVSVQLSKDIQRGRHGMGLSWIYCIHIETPLSSLAGIDHRIKLGVNRTHCSVLSSAFLYFSTI